MRDICTVLLKSALWIIILYTCWMTFDLVYTILQILVKYRQQKSDWAVGIPSSPFSFSDSQIKGLLKDVRGNGWHAAIDGSHVVSSLVQNNCSVRMWICFHKLCVL